MGRKRSNHSGVPDATPIALNLAPMVDVTMCLLVFFILATRLVERETSAKIDLPVARSALEVDKQDLGSRFVINIQDGEMSGVDGPVYIVDEKQLSLDEVMARLAKQKSLIPDINCVIRGDKHLPYKYVQKVMANCAGLGVTKVTFSAIPRSQGGPG